MMNTIKGTILTLVCLSVTLSCATQVTTLQDIDGVEKLDEMHFFFVSGVGQTKEVDAAEVCDGADKVVRIETSRSFLDVLIGFLTTNIVYPRSIAVFCKQ